MSIKMSLITFSLITSSLAFASVDCPSNYPNGNTLTYSSGAMNYPNGNTLRYSSGAMNYPNGNTLRYSSGAMNYQNGNTLMYSSGAMNYPNGNTLRYASGTLNDPNGNTNQTGSIVLSAPFGDSSLKITARNQSVRFQTQIPYGSDAILNIEFDHEGNVTCEVEGGSTSQEFKVTGQNGSAFVNVNPGADASSIKKQIQKILDGN